MPVPTLRCYLDGALPQEVAEFVREIFGVLQKKRNIVTEEVVEQTVTSDAPLDHTLDATFLHVSPQRAPGVECPQICNLEDFFSYLCLALGSCDREPEARYLQHVLHLCLADKELGGLGLPESSFDVPWEAGAKALEEVKFLVEAWLEALNSSESAFSLPEPLKVKACNTRPMTLSEKIFAHHAFQLPSSSGLKVGDLIRVAVDWIVASELSWVGMKHSMLTIGEQPSVWRNDRFWLAGDHTVDPRTYELPRVRELMAGMTEAKKDFKMTENQGSNYTILHTEFVRERAEPGMLVLGSDSHTCSAGAVSCLAIGLGAADVMAALATGETWFKIPESIKIEFIGQPAWYIRGKDVILYILKELKRNTYAADRIVEFGGPGAQYLTCDARFAIANMCTELGGITGIFVPDQVTHAFVNDRKRSMYQSNSLYFQPDENAAYAATFTIDLSNVESFIALYPSPDNVLPVSEKLDMIFDGCFIGACTTTEEEFILAALVLEAGLKNHTPLAPGKRIVVPGSLPIVRNLKDLGLLDIYAKAGFEQPAPGCSLCLGMGADRAASGENWLSSQNRNFKNRMGKGSIGNICSAATVAASSFNMNLTDPRQLLAEVSAERYAELLKHLKKSKTKAGSHAKDILEKQSPGPLRYVEPFLSPRPAGLALEAASTRREDTRAGKLQQIVKSKVYALGDFVDTDAIIPASFILESPTDDLLGSHCLEFTNPDFRQKVRDGCSVVVAGKAFGCGSSREEAPRALKGLGVKCVIAKSFSFIYGRNQPTIALLGITIDDEEFYTLAETGTDIAIDISGRKVDVGGRSFPFVLDDMELSLIKSQGLAAAYLKFGKTLFQSLCENRTPTKVSELAELKLKPEEDVVRAELAW